MADGLTTNVLGRTGLDVTKLGYGAMALRESSDDVSERVLNAVLDAGITFIDTSNDYGHSEEMIGKYVSGRRSEYYLATKCGCPPAGGDHVWTRENLFRGLHESLERLKTDYVDIMQLHNAKLEDVDQGGLVDALEEMREQGKVRWIGASAVLPSITTFVERGAFDEYQIPYSALDRAHEEAISDAARSGAGTVIRGGVQQGEPGLSSRGVPSGGRRSRRPGWTSSEGRARAARRSCCATRWHIPACTRRSLERRMRTTCGRTWRPPGAARCLPTRTRRRSAGCRRSKRARPASRRSRRERCSRHPGGRRCTR